MTEEQSESTDIPVVEGEGEGLPAPTEPGSDDRLSPEVKERIEKLKEQLDEKRG